MDSTVIAQECIVELAKATGKSQAVYEITEKAMAGEIDFDTAFKERVAMLEGAGEDVIDTVCNCLEINPGMKSFALVAKEKGIDLHLVSGGFNPMAKHIAETLDFKAYHSNPLDVKDGKLSGVVREKIVNGSAKKDYVARIMKESQLDSSQIIVVGDGANDLGMMSLSEINIGYKPKEALYQSLQGVNTRTHDSLIHLISKLGS